MKKLFFVSLVYFLVVGEASACIDAGGHNNPVLHRPYVGDTCVYYDGRGVGLITAGPYKQFIISDALVDGFDDIRSGRPDLAFKKWLSLAERGNDAANYNVGVMMHRGLGTPVNWVAALDYLAMSKQTTHWGSANAYRVRILQQALIGLGFLKGKADGDFGAGTDAAVDLAIAKISGSGPRPNQDDWYFYAIVEEFRKRGGWRSDESNPATHPDSVPVNLPKSAKAFSGSGAIPRPDRRSEK